MQPPIFRKVALDRLSSPEQLDQLMRVTSIRSWQMLAVLGLLLGAGILWALFGTISTKIQANGILVQENVRFLMNASNGVLTAWKINEGDTVSVGQTVATIANPDHVNDMQVISPFSGRIASLKVRQNDYVAAGEPLLAVESPTSLAPQLRAVLYVPLDTSTQLIPGMETHLFPSGTRVQESGYLRGTIESVGVMPVTSQEVLRLTGSTVLAGKLQTADSMVEVIIVLDHDQSNGQGYSWSLPQHSPKDLASGTLCSAEIVTSKQTPIDVIFARPVNVPASSPQKATVTATQSP